MSKAMNHNKILRGSYGKVWIDGELFANIKKFEAKVEAKYEDVEIAGQLGKKRRYVGFEGKGTATLHKIDSSIAKKLNQQFKTGDIMDSKMVVALDDPTAYGSERVEILEVTFDELTLMNFEQKAIIEEELPFEFGDYNFIDFI